MRALTLATLTLCWVTSAAAQVFECHHKPDWDCNDGGCRVIEHNRPPIVGRNTVTTYDLRARTYRLCQDLQSGDTSRYPPVWGPVQRHCAPGQIDALRLEREPIRNEPAYYLDDAPSGARSSTIIFPRDGQWRFTQSVTIAGGVRVTSGTCRRVS